jgi:hypothetical protein
MPNDFNDEVMDELGFNGIKTQEAQKMGLKDAPSTNKLGGIVVNGDISREVTVNFELIRDLRSSDGRHRELQEYILGLALLSIVTPLRATLRQGCVLVPNVGKQLTQTVLHLNGKEDELDIVSSYDDVKAFAEQAATTFGVGDSAEHKLDKAAATKWRKYIKDKKDKDK